MTLNTRYLWVFCVVITRKLHHNWHMRLLKLFPALVVICGVSAAFAGGPAWQSGVVRELVDNYTQVSVVGDRQGSPGLEGHGNVLQYCTVESGNKLYVGERAFHNWFGHELSINEKAQVAIRLEGDKMEIRDAMGNKGTFRIIKTVPATHQAADLSQGDMSTHGLIVIQ